MTYYRNGTTTVGNRFTEYAVALLRQRHGDPRITGFGQQLFECDYTAFGRIADKVHSTFPVCEIDRICQVNAPQMYGMYLLRKEEMQVQCTGRPYAMEVQELELFHVTTESKGNESLKNGLDWRRTKRSKFGRGVSFSDDADYADYYANNTSSEDDKRVIIVCAVLVAKTWRVNNNNKNKRFPGSELIAPPGTCDTTVSPNGRVYVKYYDYEFYPLYMVYYRRRPEHVALSRYHNKNGQRTGPAVQQQQQQQQQQRQRSTLAETERRRREQEERERRQKEEQLLRHQQMRRQQEERRLLQKQADQRRLWQSQESERLRREQLARSNHLHGRRQQQAGASGRRQEQSCHIL